MPKKTETTKPTDMTASDVMRALRRKHHGDVFVPECKTGPTHTAARGKCPRLDAWVMSRSWVNERVTGYEIKVSRSDFMRDDKWQAYLEFCHDFYFICPWGMIQPGEMPDGVGLAWVAKNLSRVVRKRKSVVRDIQIPDTVYRYILMSRASISRHEIYGVNENSPASRARRREEAFDEALRIMREKDDSSQIGHMLAGKLRKAIEHQIWRVETENRALKSRADAIEYIAERAKALGIDLSRRYSSEHQLREAVAAMRVAERGVNAECLRELSVAALKLAECLPVTQGD